MYDFESEIEKVTAETNMNEDLAHMLDIIENVKNNEKGSTEFMKAIVKRLKYGLRNPFVLVQCLSLLNVAVKNCDEQFKLQISSRDFVNELKILANKAPTKIVSRMAHLLKEWIDTNEFSGRRHHLLVSLCEELNSKGFGMDASISYNQFSQVTETEAQMAIKEKEDHDLAEAIAESLKLNKMEQPVVRKAKALYDFEALESDELTFREGDVITVIDESDKSWFKGSIGDRIGLFPATFVTFDFDRRDYCSNENTESSNTVNESSFEAAKDYINESLMDSCIEYLHNLDPVSVDVNDEPYRRRIEDQCYRMGPLIDSELNRIDNLLNTCTQAYSKLMDSMQSYHKLSEQQSSHITGAISAEQPTSPNLNVNANVQHFGPPLPTQINHQSFFTNYNEPQIQQMQAPQSNSAMQSFGPSDPMNYHLPQNVLNDQYISQQGIYSGYPLMNHQTLSNPANFDANVNAISVERQQQIMSQPFNNQWPSMTTATALNFPTPNYPSTYSQQIINAQNPHYALYGLPSALPPQNNAPMQYPQPIRQIGDNPTFNPQTQTFYDYSNQTDQ